METITSTEHAFLQLTTKGDISSLRWIESSHKLKSPRELCEGGQLVHVYYSALNFDDLMLATGKFDSGAGRRIGCEISGRKITGERVMAIVTGETGVATSCLVTNDDLLWSVPDNWTLEEAATVPIAYYTAYYALLVRGSLRQGESVLIHSGTDDVGLAAISICFSMRCRVLATIDTQEKAQYLLHQFFDLEENDIFNSLDASFERDVLTATGQQGVDLVLNLPSDDKLETSDRLVGQNGRFIEIARNDSTMDNEFSISVSQKNISFHRVLVDQLIAEQSATFDDARKIVRRLMDKGIADRTVRPLIRTVFTQDRASDAFRHMTTSEHIGKVLIEMTPEEEEKSCPPTPQKISAVARTFFYETKSYIIIGGLGGFGLELAHWMVSRGARNFILTSRSGVKDAYQNFCLERLEKMGATVIVSTLDVTDAGATSELFDIAMKLGSIGGIFNLALVLRDTLLTNQTEESFREVSVSKVTTSINLDKESRVKCPHLDHFVLFSSIACAGNAGQTNYALANSSMEKICEERRKIELPALAIQWGLIADVGCLGDASLDTVISGTAPQRIHSCLSVLDRMMLLDATVVASTVLRFKETFAKASSSQASGDGLLISICNILGVSDASSVSPTTTLQDVGMDSLMSIEIKQTLDRLSKTKMALSEVRSLTFEKLYSISREANAVESTLCNDLLSNNLIESSSFDEKEHSSDASSVSLNKLANVYRGDLSIHRAKEQNSTKNFVSGKEHRMEKKPMRDLARNSSQQTVLSKVKSEITELQVGHANPLSVLLNNDPGARSLFALISSIFIVIAVNEELKCYFNEEERIRRNNFWRGQLSTWPFFVTTWLCMHIILCVVVYPAGRLMREKSNTLYVLSAFTCIILIKCIIFQSYRIFAPSGSMGLAIGAESTRIFMKIISYLAECRRGEVRSKVTLSRFIYFLLAPTLIYRSEYSRTPGAINWWQALKYFFGFSLLMYIQVLWAKDYFEPIVQIIQMSHETSQPLTNDHLIRIFFICCIAVPINFLAIAIGLFHYFFNCMAELLRYSDRQFFKQWWTTKTTGEFLRSWNYLVHQWIDRYIFIGIMNTFGRLPAFVGAFIFSGFYHDYVNCVALGFFLPGFMIQMALSAVVFILEPVFMYLDSKFPHFLLHNLKIYGLMFFVGPIVIFTTLEHQSRVLCPHLYGSDVFDFFAIRFHNCIEF